MSHHGGGWGGDDGSLPVSSNDTWMREWSKIGKKLTPIIEWPLSMIFFVSDHPNFLSWHWSSCTVRLYTILPGVNFINVLRTNFLYEHCFSSYVLALSKNLYKKFARLTLMKLTAGYNRNYSIFQLLERQLCEQCSVGESESKNMFQVCLKNNQKRSDLESILPLFYEQLLSIQVFLQLLCAHSLGC